MKTNMLPASTPRIPFPGLSMVKRIFALTLGLLVNTTFVHGQRTDSGADADRQNFQMLLQKVEQLEARNAQLEARVAQLEGANYGKTRVSSSPSPTSPGMSSANKTEPRDEQVETSETEASETLLKIRGYGDFTLHGDNQKGDKTSFSLGELNLFITSNISEKFKFLTELVFEADQTNVFKAEPERVLLQYSYSDYLKLSAGRYHTAIGYYNTAYHHSTWFQTTTGRPYLFQFEDDGGILPVHNVGVSASGQIPSGPLGLHYVVEVGNGRASRSPQDEPVQNVVDEGTHKAVNLALFARPEAIPDLQVGFFAYHDVLTPFGLPNTGQTILDAYAVLVRPRFEWLNEALVIRDTPLGGRLFQTPGFYTQISERFGSYRPYFRYQYVNAPNNEPVFQNSYGIVVGRRQGPSVGLRYDASESVAVKLQYDYTSFRQQQAISSLALQVGFTF